VPIKILYKKHPLFFAVLVFLLIPALVHAQDKEKRWSVSPLLGISSPKLELLNEGEFKSPIAGRGTVVFPEDVTSETFVYEIQNDLPKIDYGTDVGIEFQLALTKKDSFVMGISNWEGSATSVVTSEIPFQGVLSEVTLDRSGTVSAMQYYLGWKRNVIQKPKKYNIYTKLTLNEVFDVDYKEDLVYGFQTGPAETFKRLIVMETQSTGILMFQLGLGMEYFLRDWLSFGFDSSYAVGFNEFELSNGKITSDFQPDDNVFPILPTQLLDNKLRYLTDVSPSGAPTYEQMKLSLDGWQLLFRFNIYY
jgi:hypothetical protein